MGTPQRRFGPLTHGSDAEFQAWATMLRDMMLDAGFVQTADTGQADTATLVRPATSGSAGYLVFRFDDSLQSTAPVFIRVTLRTGNSVLTPAIGVSVGFATDGAGNISGAGAGEVISGGNGTTPTFDRYHFVVHNQWGAAVALGQSAAGGSGANPGIGFVIQRTADSSGAPTADGVVLHVCAATNGHTSVGRAYFLQRFPVPALQSMTGEDVAHLPGSLSDYEVGVSPQLLPTWCAMPAIRPLMFALVAPQQGLTIGQEFPMTVLGTTPRNYIVLGPVCNRQFSSNLTSHVGYTCVIWE